MEADLRSREKKKRTLHFFVNGMLEKIFFYNIPERVKMGVVLSLIRDTIMLDSMTIPHQKKEMKCGWKQIFGAERRRREHSTSL